MQPNLNCSSHLSNLNVTQMQGQEMTEIQRETERNDSLIKVAIAGNLLPCAHHQSFSWTILQMAHASTSLNYLLRIPYQHTSALKSTALLSSLDA